MLKSLTSLLARKNLGHSSLKCRQSTRFERNFRCCTRHNLKNEPSKLRLCRTYSTNVVWGHTFFLQKENAFAHNVLTPLTAVGKLDKKVDVPVRAAIRSDDDFRRYLDRDWGKCGTEEIVGGFEAVLGFCEETNVDVSDVRFDKLVDGLIDNVERFTKDEIASVLNFLIASPRPDGATAHNYHDMWSALDDICCWRMREWDLQTCIEIAELWYRLGLGRICDFICEVLEKYSRKPERLSKTELVHIFFYFNVCRKKKMEFSYENAVEQKIHLMNVDEIGIVAMGFFKTNTRVKSIKTLNTMIDCVMSNSKSIHEITLAAIVKVVRMSQQPATADKSMELLQRIIPEIPRLSNLSCLHLSLLGTRLQMCSEEAFTAICEKLSQDLHDLKAIRLKDVERLLLGLTMFDLHPKITTGDIYELLVRELRNPERRSEIEMYPKCLPNALLFLSIRDIYLEDLIDEVLNIAFVQRVYGKRFADIPRELLTLNTGVEIERPEYKGHTIPMDLRRKNSKFFIERLPDRGKRNIATTDKFTFDIMDTCSNVVGDSNRVFVGHILPYLPKADIVLCYDRTEKEFVRPPLEKYQVGDVFRPFSTMRYKWFVMVPITVNTTIRYVMKPMGSLNMKVRQLRRLRYEPILVPYHEFLPLDEDTRVDYVRSKINQFITH